jgi:ATPase subunit of ABC transporter with duplicated ATPase domains
MTSVLNSTRLGYFAARHRRLYLTRQFSEVILSAKDLCFEYIQKKPVLSGANFSIRNNNKITIMGQNGSGEYALCDLRLSDSVLFR